MNNQKRKRLDKVAYMLQTQEINNDLIISAKDEIEDVKFEEEMAFDNLGESLQQTMRGQAMEEAIEYMEEACQELKTVLQYIEDNKSENDIRDKIDDVIENIEYATM